MQLHTCKSCLKRALATRIRCLEVELAAIGDEYDGLYDRADALLALYQRKLAGLRALRASVRRLGTPSDMRAAA